MKKYIIYLIVLLTVLFFTGCKKTPLLQNKIAIKKVDYQYFTIVNTNQINNVLYIDEIKYAKELKLESKFKKIIFTKKKKFVFFGKNIFKKINNNKSITVDYIAEDKNYILVYKKNIVEIYDKKNKKIFKHKKSSNRIKISNNMIIEKNKKNILIKNFKTNELIKGEGNIYLKKEKILFFLSQNNKPVNLLKLAKSIQVKHKLENLDFFSPIFFKNLKIKKIKNNQLNSLNLYKLSSKNINPLGYIISKQKPNKIEKIKFIDVKNQPIVLASFNTKKNTFDNLLKIDNRIYVQGALIYNDIRYQMKNDPYKKKYINNSSYVEPYSSKPNDYAFLFLPLLAIDGIKNSMNNITSYQRHKEVKIEFEKVNVFTTYVCHNEPNECDKLNSALLDNKETRIVKQQPILSFNINKKYKTYLIEPQFSQLKIDNKIFSFSLSKNNVLYSFPSKVIRIK